MGNFVQIGNSKAVLANMIRSAKNKLRAFGGNAALQLSEGIKKHAKRFHQLPVGPLGYHLTLTDGRCATQMMSVGRCRFNGASCDKDVPILACAFTGMT